MRQILAAVFQLIFLVINCPKTDSFYNNSEVQYKSFEWEPMIELHNNSVPSQILLSKHNKSNFGHSNPFASHLLNQPVYVTLTTIHSRIYGIVKTIESIIFGAVLPDHIYIFVSKDPHLLDLGVTPEFILSESKGKLNEIILNYPWISVIFTENNGPHRKLLPLLAKKWNEDCVIVTIDDHELYGRSFLQSLLEYYEASDRSAVVALRARRMGICSDAPPWRIAPYTKHKKGLWPEASPGHREMLLLPTGTGGVLYRPKFFHPVVFDRRLITLTKTGDDLMFRLATIMMGVPVVTACADKDALGKICQFRSSKKSRFEILTKAEFFQRSIIISRNSRLSPKKKEGSSAISDFTFGHNYTDDLLNGNLLSPGVHTLQVTDNKKSRNKPKDKNKDKKREIALAILNNPSGVRVRYLEEESSNLRTEPTMKDWKYDPRKKESLAAIFNNVGGNNEMWDISLKYLFDTKKINFEDMLQIFVPFERKNCLIHSNIVQRKYGEGFNYMLRNGIDSLKVSLQKLYSPECGICVCSYNKNVNLNISSELLNGHKNVNYDINANYLHVISSNFDKNDESSYKKDNNISDRDENIDSISKGKIDVMIKDKNGNNDIEITDNSPYDLVDIETGDVKLLTQNVRESPPSNVKKTTNSKRISKQINSIKSNAHNYFSFIPLTLVIIFAVVVNNRFLMKVVSSNTLR